MLYATEASTGRPRASTAIITRLAKSVHTRKTGLKAPGRVPFLRAISWATARAEGVVTATPPAGGPRGSAGRRLMGSLPSATELKPIAARAGWPARAPWRCKLRVHRQPFRPNHEEDVEPAPGRSHMHALPRLGFYPKVGGL
jgi:hypothetical protein